MPGAIVKRPVMTETLPPMVVVVEPTPELERTVERLTQVGDLQPLLYAATGDLEEITSKAINALASTNNPPEVFRRDDGLCKLRNGRIVAMTDTRLREVLARKIGWFIKKKGEVVDGRPPADLPSNINAKEHTVFPPLVRVVHCPVFAADGTIQTTPGYHAASMTWYEPQGFTMPEVP